MNCAVQLTATLIALFVGVADDGNKPPTVPTSGTSFGESKQEDLRDRRPEITNSIGMKFAKVPAGEFMMGNHDTPEELAKAFPDIEQRRIDELIEIGGVLKSAGEKVNGLKISFSNRR